MNNVSNLFFLVEEGELQGLKEFVQEKGKNASSLLNSLNETGHSVLHWAVFHNHPSVIRWLLSSEEGGGRAAGFNTILAKTSTGRTAMHIAAGYGHLECCQALVDGSMLENGERAELLNGAEADGWTALHWAAYSNHPSVIRWLLSAGFSLVTNSTTTITTPLHIAAAAGNLECCQALVESSNIENGERDELLNAVDNKGWTVLHQAASDDHASIIRWILSVAGFTNVLSKTKNGSTAMHLAAEKGHLECCQALVEDSVVDDEERKELLNAADNAGWTALHCAAHEGHASIIRWLAGFTMAVAKTIDGITALHIAAEEGYLECCRALVEGSNIENGERIEILNGVDDQGWTALHYAVQKGHASIIRWLLSSSEEGEGRATWFTSSSITAKTSNSLSALHYVARNGSVEALNALLSGCTPAERLTLFLSIDKHGWTPLHIAARYCRANAIREVLLHHPETQTIVDARDHRGMTALHRAVIGGIDEESMREWREIILPNIAQATVVEALLTTPKKDDKEQQPQQAAMIDPNLGIKIE